MVVPVLMVMLIRMVMLVFMLVLMRVVMVSVLAAHRLFTTRAAAQAAP